MIPEKTRKRNSTKKILMINIPRTLKKGNLLWNGLASYEALRFVITENPWKRYPPRTSRARHPQFENFVRKQREMSIYAI